MPFSKEDLTKDVKGLSISRKSAGKSPIQDAVAESWEDDVSTGSEGEEGVEVSPSPKLKRPSQNTPEGSSSRDAPVVQSQPAFAPDGTPLSLPLRNGTDAPPTTPDRTSDRGGRRPEKTTAPAARMIAGALGVRAPKKTEEQRQYEKAIRDKEAKRRDDERERKKLEESERERLKREAWDG